MQRTVNTAVAPGMFATTSADAVAVLRELFEILEDYAPTWYTEELHNRTAAVLGEPVFEPCLS
ncbi:MAG TPA: hypothetical protein VGL00_09455 [Terracidiphilus sp.]